MKPFPDNSNSESPLSDDQLDQLLASASLPEADTIQQRRMKRDVKQLLRRSRPSPFPRLAVQAGLVVAACGILILVAMNLRLSDHGSSELNVKNVKIANSTYITPAIETAPTQIITRVAWRPRKKSTTVSRTLKSGIKTARRTMNSLADSDFGISLLHVTFHELEQMKQQALTTGDRKTLTQLKAAFGIQTSLEKEWVSLIQSNRTTTNEKTIAFKKLCRAGSAKSLHVALGYWDRVQLQPEILSMARRHANSETLGQMIPGCHPELVETVMLELLDRGDANSVYIYLEATNRHQLYRIAESCGRQQFALAETALPTLLDALKSNRMGIAHAASITLSSINDDTITRHLFKLAQQPKHSRAAILALIGRQDKTATTFVELASNDIRWSATIVNARKKWSRLLASN